MKIILQFNSQSKSQTILQAIEIAKNLKGERDGRYYKLFFDSIDDHNLLKLSSLVETLKTSRIFIDGEDCGLPNRLIERVDSIVDCNDYSSCFGKCSYDDKFELKIVEEYCTKFERRISIEEYDVSWINNEDDFSSPKDPDNKYVWIEGRYGPNSLVGVEMEEADLILRFSDNEESIPKERGFALNILFLGLKDILQIEGLEKLTDLKKLDLCGNEINEIRGLEKLINLEYLDLSRNKITEITGLENLINLKALNLEVNKIKVIKGLENLVNLIDLDLSENPISEIKGLENLVNLKQLGLNYTKIREEELMAIAGEDLLEELKEENSENKRTYYSIYNFPDYAQKFVNYSHRKKKMLDQEDKEKIQKIEKMLAESNSLILDTLRDTLKIDAHTFNNKVLDWALEYGFEIDGDYLITNKSTISDFINELDNYFILWNKESNI